MPIASWVEEMRSALRECLESGSFEERCGEWVGASIWYAKALGLARILFYELQTSEGALTVRTIEDLAELTKRRSFLTVPLVLSPSL